VGTGATIAVIALVGVGGFVGYKLLNAKLAGVTAATQASVSHVNPTTTGGKVGEWITDFSNAWGLGKDIYNTFNGSTPNASPTSVKG